jgi:hypothetical protein
MCLQLRFVFIIIKLFNTQRVKIKRMSMKITLVRVKITLVRVKITLVRTIAVSQ